MVTLEYRILHGLTSITYDLTYAPTDHLDSQLQSITALRDASESWASSDETPAPNATIPLPHPSQTR